MEQETAREVSKMEKHRIARLIITVAAAGCIGATALGGVSALAASPAAASVAAGSHAAVSVTVPTGIGSGPCSTGSGTNTTPWG
jgi:hypothetical protein